jgi:hypothetical protein
VRSSEVTPPPTDGHTQIESRNEKLFVAAETAVSVATMVAVSGVLLPWVWVTLGVSVLLMGMIIPVMQGGRLSAQLLVVPWMYRIKQRKWLVVGAQITLAVCLLSLGILAASSLIPSLAAPAILALAFLFGTSFGISLFGIQEVTARTIHRERRGRLLSRAGTIGGWLALAAAVAIYRLSPAPGQGSNQLLHILIGAGMWLASASFVAAIHEHAMSSYGGQHFRKILRQGVALVREHALFKRFLLLNILLPSVALAYPFYAAHAAAIHGTHGSNLSLIIVFTCLAGILQEPVWGRHLDARPRHGLILALMLATAAGLLVIAVEAFDPLRHPIAHGIAFLLVVMAGEGGANARRVYLIQLASEQERPLLIAMSDTVRSLVGLAAGAGLGAVAHYQHVALTIVILVMTHLLAALVVWRGLER